MMDRRTFLRAMPLVGVVPAAPAIATKTEAAVFEPLVYAEDRGLARHHTPPTQIERIEAAVAELRRTMNAYTKSKGGNWTVGMTGRRDGGDITVVTRSYKQAGQSSKSVIEEII